MEATAMASRNSGKARKISNTAVKSFSTLPRLSPAAKLGAKSVDKKRKEMVHKIDDP